MTDTSRPFAEKKFTEVKGHRMAFIDEGEGAPIVFQHGNPTSSYLWRNVMPACRGLGRLIACDLIGMGDSDKLYPSGPDRYTYAEQRDFLFALWDKLGLGNDVVFVVHEVRPFEHYATSRTFAVSLPSCSPSRLPGRRTKALLAPTRFHRRISYAL